MRPLADVTADCRKIMMGKLPGNRMVKATWAALCEASSIARESEVLIDDDHVSDRERRIMIGERYAAARIVRKIADALGVPNVIDN